MPIQATDIPPASTPTSANCLIPWWDQKEPSPLVPDRGVVVRAVDRSDAWFCPIIGRKYALWPPAVPPMRGCAP